VRSNRIGFLVDAAIYGFAIGAGFALVETVAYWNVLSTHTWSLWVVRGFGTAVMHGGATAICAIVGKALEERGGGAAVYGWPFAFLAMARMRVGDRPSAEKAFAELSQLMQIPNVLMRRENQSLLLEAEGVLRLGQ